MKTKPPFKPEPAERKQVEAMAAYGITGVDIAHVLGIGYTTLKKYFREELDLGHVRANASVAETCFKMATSGKCPAATFFWLKTRARWRETNNLEISNTTNPETGQGDVFRIEYVNAKLPAPG